jgi:outer membrane protein assembly factor BamB
MKQRKEDAMKISELVFVGIGRSVVALNRETGEKVWATRIKGYDFVNVVLDGDRLYATCNGEIYCMDPVTGDGLWHNPLKGFGTGLASIATERAPGGGLTAALAEKHNQDQTAASAVATAGT